MKKDDEEFEEEGHGSQDQNSDESGDESLRGMGNLDDIMRNARSVEPEFPLEPQNGLTSEIENRLPRRLNEKEVKVIGVYEHQEQGLAPSAFVLLRDKQDRQVVIFIGRFEAVAISVALEGATYPRPMTHDLLKNMIDRLGGKVDRILIDDLWQETYYAKISLSLGKESWEVDARPSDAIALGLRANAPIYMAESVLQQSVTPEEP